MHLANGVWGVIAAGLFASKEAYSASYYADRADRYFTTFSSWDALTTEKDIT